MVYGISANGISEQFSGTVSVPRIRLREESLIARILTKLIISILFIYDLISLPIYFMIRRPDQLLKAAKKTKSERVDNRTWIRVSFSPSGRDKTVLTPEPIIEARSKWSFNCGHGEPFIFLGSTISEIFCNSIRLFSSKPCLGYRALITCPDMSLNEEGQYDMRNKSFRSDFTWYTFEQIGRRVQDIASGLNFHRIYPGVRALFVAATNLEWFCSAQACFQLGAQVVIAPEINDALTIRQIIKESKIEIVFASCDTISRLTKVFEGIKSDDNYVTICIKSIVIMDWLFPVDFNESLFNKLRVSTDSVVDQIMSLGEIEEIGAENPIELSISKYSYNVTDYESFSNRVSPPRQTGGKTNKKLVSLRQRSKSLIYKKESLDNPIGGTVEDASKEIGRDGPMSLNIDESHSSRVATRFVSKVVNQLKPSDIALIVYTYGSMGQVKSLMMTHDYIARNNQHLRSNGIVVESDTHCATLPLDNVLEFMTQLCIISHGGCIGYSCNQSTLFYDGKDLFERDKSDLAALNPNFLLVRPFILERLRTSMQNYLHLYLNPLTAFLITDVLYDYKKYWAKWNFSTPIVDYLFCSRLKRLFGNNLDYILCTGATDCSETKDFFAFAVNIPVIEVHGPNEAPVSLISVNNTYDHRRKISLLANYREQDENDEMDYSDLKLMPPRVNSNRTDIDTSRNLLVASSILCPAFGARVKLMDWGDFRISDRPYPRGRLVLGGDVVCLGYFNRNNLTDEHFHLDSNEIFWFQTDDIVRAYPNGTIEIISGISDMIKMVDGQFISLSQVEHILRNSQFVDNVCAVCGEDRTFIICLVVPNLRRLALKSLGDDNIKMSMGVNPEPEELTDIEFRREVCNDRLLCEFVSRHLSELLSKAGLKDITSRFHLVPEIWTPETELVTPSFEPKRMAIQKHYAIDIQSILKMEFAPSRKRLSARLDKVRMMTSSPRLAHINSNNLGRLSY